MEKTMKDGKILIKKLKSQSMHRKEYKIEDFDDFKLPLLSLTTSPFKSD